MKKPAIYLAGSYTLKDQIGQCRDALNLHGFPVTSSWLRERHSPQTRITEVTPRFLRNTAKMDLQDIARARLVIVFTMIPIPRGGHVVETGVAIALKKQLILCGPKENVFHYLPGVKQFDTFPEVLDWLEKRYA